MNDVTDETLTLMEGDQTVRVCPRDEDHCRKSDCIAEIIITDAMLGPRVVVHLSDQSREIMIRALGGEAW